jgi:predicted membrane protein
MKWLLSLLKKFLADGDPNLTPKSVRAGSALVIMASYVVTEIAIVRHLSLLHSLAALSIVWGVYAALIRYWERFSSSDQDLQRVKQFIIRKGSTTKLSFATNTSIIALAHLSFVMALLISAGAVQTAIYHPSQLKLPIWLALLVIWIIYFPSAALLAYG